MFAVIELDLAAQRAAEHTPERNIRVIFVAPPLIFPEVQKEKREDRTPLIFAPRSTRGISGGARVPVDLYISIFSRRYITPRRVLLFRVSSRKRRVCFIRYIFAVVF